ncbi:MAG TPA: alpha/beta fold hydrolase [Stenomitos sp.]
MSLNPIVPDQSSTTSLTGKSRWKKTLIQWSLGIGGIYVLACGLLYTQQGRFIFAPTGIITETPADHGLAYQSVDLPLEPTPQTKQQTDPNMDRIFGWWIPAQQPQAKTILYLHGNGINIGANAEQASRFHKLGCSVFLFDYRGYGKSTGAFPSEASTYADAQRAWTYLVQERKIAPNQIVIYGHSLGGAIAIDLAVQHPDAFALIVQSSFTSAVEMAQRNWWTAAIPIDLLLTQRFDSIHKVPQLKMPVLYIHGTNDERIPYAMSQRLFAATRAPKQLKLFAKAGHNNVAAVAGEAYYQTIRAFFNQADKTACKDCSVTRQIRQSGNTSAPILR